VGDHDAMTKTETATVRRAQRRIALAADARRPDPVRMDAVGHARRALAQLSREERFAHLRRMYD